MSSMASGPFYKQGKYAVSFTGEQGFSETQNGNTQFFLRFEVTHVAMGEEWEPVSHSYSRTYYRVINANTVEFAVTDLKAMGFTGDSFKVLDPRWPQPFIFEGQAVMICNHESWGNGAPKEVWSPFRENGASAKAVDLIDSKKLKQLDMLFGKAFKGEKIDQPAPPKAAGPPALPARSISGLPPKDGLVSQPRPKAQVPDAVQDPITGYAVDPQPVRPAQAAVASLEIDDSDLPF